MSIHLQAENSFWRHTLLQSPADCFYFYPPRRLEQQDWLSLKGAKNSAGGN